VSTPTEAEAKYGRTREAFGVQLDLTFNGDEQHEFIKRLAETSPDSVATVLGIAEGIRKDALDATIERWRVFTDWSTKDEVDEKSRQHEAVVKLATMWQECERAFRAVKAEKITGQPPTIVIGAMAGGE
jgi:hypothetical protein